MEDKSMGEGGKEASFLTPSIDENQKARTATEAAGGGGETPRDLAIEEYYTNK